MVRFYLLFFLWWFGWLLVSLWHGCYVLSTPDEYYGRLSNPDVVVSFCLSFNNDGRVISFLKRMAIRTNHKRRATFCCSAFYKSIKLFDCRI